MLGEIDSDLHNELIKLFPLNNCFIVIGKNESFAIALWEVGYQLLNLLLQAHSLDILYQAALLDETQKTLLRRMGVKDPVAVFAI